MGTNTELYEKDFCAWTDTTAALLRVANIAEIDLAVLAEEVESLGKSARRALRSEI